MSRLENNDTSQWRKCLAQYLFLFMVMKKKPIVGFIQRERKEKNTNTEIK